MSGFLFLFVYKYLSCLAMAVASLGGLFITITGTSMGVGILTGRSIFKWYTSRINVLISLQR